MTSGKLLKKYFWFLRAFQSGPISRQEISRRWLSSPMNDDKKAHSRLHTLHSKQNTKEGHLRLLEDYHNLLTCGKTL